MTRPGGGGGAGNMTSGIRPAEAWAGVTAVWARVAAAWARVLQATGGGGGRLALLNRIFLLFSFLLFVIPALMVGD